jgi:hypothetical protein
MRVLTGKAVLACEHGGLVDIKSAQDWVKIDGVPVLVEPDPLHRPVVACPRMTPTTPPCTLTISIDESASYSALVSIDGRRVCMDSATGRTNWSLLTIVPYAVREAGQTLTDVGA